MNSDHPLKRQVPIIEAVRGIYQSRRSGLIEIEAEATGPGGEAQPKRRLFFADGELHLPQVNALARRLAPHLPIGSTGDSEELRSEVASLMERVAHLLHGWEASEYAFFEGNHLLPPDLVGPFPTAALLMEWAVMDLSHDDLLEQLGGGGNPFRAVSASPPEALAPLLSPDDLALLKRLTKPVELGPLVTEAADDATETLRRLGRLKAIGLVRGGTRSPVSQGTQPVPVDVLKSLADRVGRDLAARPVDLDSSEHRARLRDLLADSGGMTHYELFGIGQEAKDEDIHDAYDRVARLVHPSHAEGLHLEGREEALWLLFERATDAYLTLNDPSRRSRYNTHLGISLDPSPNRHQREGESQRLAVSYFRQGKSMLANEEYHFAVELLQQAVQADPKGEYYLALAESQEQNPNWLRRAAESYRRAIEMGSDEAAVWNALGRVHERMGQFEQARLQFGAALRRTPGDPEAEAGLARIEALRAPAKAAVTGGGGGVKSFLSRLLRKPQSQ